MAQDWRTYGEEQQQKRRRKYMGGLDDRFAEDDDTVFTSIDPRGGYGDLSFIPAKKRKGVIAPNLYDATPEQYNDLAANYKAGQKPHELDKRLRVNRFRYQPNLHNRKGFNEYLLNHPHQKGYIGDVDKDKIDDYIVTNSEGEILYYNGYNIPKQELWHNTYTKMVTYMKAIMFVIKVATTNLKDNPDYIKQTQALKQAGKRRNIGAIAGIIARHLIMRMLPNRYFIALAEAKRKQAENIGIPKEQLLESAKLNIFEKYMIGAWTAINKDPAIRKIFINLVLLAFEVKKDEKGVVQSFEGSAFQALLRAILSGDGTPLAREMEKFANAASTRTDYGDYVVRRFNEELQAYGTRKERRDRAKRKKVKKGYVAPVPREYEPYYALQQMEDEEEQPAVVQPVVVPPGM